jgi:hypothetical protein
MYAVRLSDIGDTVDAVPAGVGGDEDDRDHTGGRAAEATKVIKVWRR